MLKRRFQPQIPVDLAAVCSVAFVVLLLYLSMSIPKLPEPVEINLPATSDISCSIDGYGEAMILLGQGKIFLQITGELREKTLEQIAVTHNIHFTKPQIERFIHTAYIGLPVVAFKQDAVAVSLPGINNNELADWISAINKAYYSIHQHNIKVTIKADKDTGYALLKKVMATVQDQHINRFSFVANTKTNH